MAFETTSSGVALLLGRAVFAAVLGYLAVGNLLDLEETVGALAVVGFLVGVTPVMHDFWTMEGIDRQNEQIHFLKNAGLAGAALVFLALSTTAWPYAVGLTIV